MKKDDRDAKEELELAKMEATAPVIGESDVSISVSGKDEPFFAKIF